MQKYNSDDDDEPDYTAMSSAAHGAADGLGSVLRPKRRNHRQEKELQREKKKSRIERAIEQSRAAGPAGQRPIGGAASERAWKSSNHGDAPSADGHAAYSNRDGENDDGDDATGGTVAGGAGSSSKSAPPPRGGSHSSSSASGRFHRPGFYPAEDAAAAAGGANSEATQQARMNAGLGPRAYTVSVAIPGSVLHLAQSAELKTYMAGQIARSLSLFNVDEIVIYNDGSGGKQASSSIVTTEGEFEGAGKQATSNPDVFLARVLQYLETPQYLRRQLFPMHRDLKFAGLLAPIESAHHPKQDEFVEFREGLVQSRSKGQRGNAHSHGPASAWDDQEGGEQHHSAPLPTSSFVDVGLRTEAKINVALQPGTRVTVQFPQWSVDNKDGHFSQPSHHRYPSGNVVTPSLPRELRGLYWGYSVRLVPTLSRALVDCPFNERGRYDLLIGAGDEGDSVDDMSELPEFKHALIVFGGVSGLPAAIEADESMEAHNPRAVFSKFLSTCPSRGCRSVRPDESLLISLAALRPHLAHAGVKSTGGVTKSTAKRS
ncbi:DNA segment Chr 2 Wayne State University 81 expressed [Capsaspora owczarzaki ATCC 30864]|uniref:DNA segment Chr 2 Wayne State University 81 expressed n=1 Tax=Capsaspora owczarzaki (strain ATCC 30864) TaxID=595528 RepID=A0A0D2WPC3_CAPO3|nr:DNA segment Chr 2 Wayne State University 81 expressed [Capsaspora owczarzaki ATCC 30864]KJE93175.1 DNA segment Chr 2 Wayne State University 81 expressed [Capsaspora owczarzaki ATCC 30864]|eukprot:XP_004347826.1 DNA segment Chr 2 Wayne State University 81 expressed [Capsaspora owczarzaki ATCC 30864]